MIQHETSAAWKILITGASGFIASVLVPCFTNKGWEVFRLTRGEPRNSHEIQWDPMQPVDLESVSGFDAVVHLAGENIFSLWTTAKKRHILESRSVGTRHLAEALAQTAAPPRVFVSASAIGYYGNRGDEILGADAPAGNGFLAEVCQAWEKAAEPALNAGIRVVHPRIGLVLSKSGGALQRMLLPFRLGFGGKIGTGRQWWSWIDVDDLAGGILHILDRDSISGAVNMVAPNPVTNAEFTKTLANALSRPAIFSIPLFAIRKLLGEMGEELLLFSQRVEPQKLAATGYHFQSPNLRAAFARILQ